MTESIHIRSALLANSQADVIFELSSIGLCPKEGFLTKTGYRMDAPVEVNGTKVGIEVDGPSHFVGRKATGRSFLKCRQVSAVDKIPVVSLPDWEWSDHGQFSWECRVSAMSARGPKRQTCNVGSDMSSTCHMTCHMTCCRHRAKTCCRRCRHDTTYLTVADMSAPCRQKSHTTIK